MIDTGIDEEKLMQYYARAFPSMNISHVYEKRNDCPVTYSSKEALNTIIMTSHVPIMDFIFERNSLPNVCVPHLHINTTYSDNQYETSPEWLHKITRTIQNGLKLSRAEKPLLHDPRLPRSQRVLLSIAYAINRCAVFSYIAIPLYLDADQIAHANMLFIAKYSKIIEISLFEPNGKKAAEQYRTRQSLFPRIESDLPKLLIDKKQVLFTIVGSGVQTALGEIETTYESNLKIVRKRGYPICQAICTYIFSKYLENPEQSLKKFDAEFVEKLQNSESRHEEQQNVFEFIKKIALWTKYKYPGVLKKSLEHIFRTSNVRHISVVFENTQVRVTIPECIH